MGTSTLAVRQPAHVTLAAWKRFGTGYLRGLSDPDFFRAWSTVRLLLVLAPAESRDEIKRLYDDVTDDYRRRMDGGLAAR